MDFSSSDSEDERLNGYQPVLAEQLSRVNSPSGTLPAAHMWPKDGVNVYHNELFTDGDVLGEEPGPSAPEAARKAPAASQQKIMQQKNSLAARRQERMQANIYERNETGIQRGAVPSAMRVPQHPALADESTSNPQTPSTHRDGEVYGMAGYYDPTEEDGVAQPRAVGPKYLSPAPKLDLSDIPSFLMTPGPKTGPVLCYIVRDKGSAKMYPKYTLCLEDGKRFLLAARKRKKQTTSNYLVSLDKEDLNRDSEKYFGKLRANFVGTEFSIYDSKDKTGKRAKDDNEDRQELGAIMYQYNVLGTRGPRKMTGVIPAVDATGKSVYSRLSPEDTLLERVKNNVRLDEVVVMMNKPPRWNEELNAYCLNFNGRVTEASVKNFQLVTDDNHSHVILQFGKIGKNAFTMDYQWPISAFQAFAICLSSFDNKLACE